MKLIEVFEKTNKRQKVETPNKLLETHFESVYTSNSKYEKEEYELNNLEVIKLF